jgi:hypothetical protein
MKMNRGEIKNTLKYKKKRKREREREKEKTGNKREKEKIVTREGEERKLECINQPRNTKIERKIDEMYHKT